VSSFSQMFEYVCIGHEPEPKKDCDALRIRDCESLKDAFWELSAASIDAKLFTSSITVTFL
jgi:hypothetical protein